MGVTKSNRYEIDPQTGCWNWLLQLNESGYGMQWDGSRTRQAHRVEFIKKYGPVPEGLELDHLCRNRRCVNPDHLEPVTRIENIRRGAMAKLTTEAVKQIRDRFFSGETCVRLAVEFGVAPNTVSAIVRGRTWIKEIEVPVIHKREKTSRATGVSFHRASRLWRAYTQTNKVRTWLGYFKTEEAAIEAVKAAKGEQHGSNNSAPAIAVGDADNAHVLAEHF